MVLRTYALIKSSSEEEYQIWEYLEWRGGRVGQDDRLRDGSNEVAAVPPGGPRKPMSAAGRSGILADTIKTPPQANVDVQDHA